MKIISTQVMRGPNIWSKRKQHLIVLKADLGKLRDYPGPQQAQLLKQLVKSLPSLKEKLHPEAPMHTDIPQMIRHVATELQELAGMSSDYGKTEPAGDKGEYYIVFSYEVEKAGLYAGHAAIEILSCLVRQEPVNTERYITELERLKEKYALGPTSAYILEEVKRRGIPFKRFPDTSLITLGYGCRQKMIRTAVADSTSGLGIEMAGDKEETKRILADAGVPVPRGLLVSDEEELKSSLSTMRFPLVTKPLDGNQGRGVTTHIHNLEQALFGFRMAKKISDTVIVEEFVDGSDYRFLVIDYKLVAVSKRTPAMVTGNGRFTVRELIEEANRDPQRGHTAAHVLAPIKVDEITQKILSEKQLTLDSVLPAGEDLYLKETANISGGGTATDVTDEVHPFNVFMAERIARLFKLDICGIDLMHTDVGIPLTRETGAVIEVNAGPGLRMHTNPQHGKARDVASPIIDMLFPSYDSFRIPVVAVTGTNGKTTTTRLVAHLAKQAGYRVGYTTTEGVYIQGHLLIAGDCTGPVSAHAVLFDPTVNFAVLECARGGILRSGLGFDSCDISIVTNVSEDHLGLGGIHTLEEMAEVKSVVPKSTVAGGHAILNADDDLVFNMHHELQCRIALFSTDPSNRRIRQHIDNGGLAALAENGRFVLWHQQRKIVVDEVAKVPLTMGGKAGHMIKNILPAMLAAFIQGIHIENIRAGLRMFMPSPEQTPGRMNLFHFRNFDLMVDYAHNVAGFSEISQFMKSVPAASKIGIISVPGDRRDQDICTIGQTVAGAFSQIIIRHDKDLRGRTSAEIETLLKEAIWSIKPEMKIAVVPDELRAIDYAVQHAPKGAFIFECADSVHQVLSYVKTLSEKEKNQKKSAKNI